MSNFNEVNAYYPSKITDRSAVDGFIGAIPKIFEAVN
jgi:hypothetical protein